MSAVAGPTVGLDVIVTASVPIPAGYVFRAPGGRLAGLLAVLRPGAETVRSPCLAYVVRHPTAGAILVDTGMHPGAHENLRRDFGVAMGTMFRALRPADEPYDAQLRGLGVAPEDVTRVVMTHLHVDHTSGMRLLPAAEFVLARAEWEAAHGRLAAARGYVRDHLPPESRVRLVDVAAEGTTHGAFARTVDLLGDASIRLVSTPGHTAGHLSVLLRLAGDRQVLLVGDAAYTLRSIDEEILPMVTADDELALRSLRELKAFADADPGALLVPSHDPTAWQAL